MNDDELSNLRDFIYLDVERVKSILTQIDRGLLMDWVKKTGSATSVEAKAGLSIPVLAEIGGAGQYASTDEESETQSLHDFVYNWTEEKLIERGRLRRLPKDFDRNLMLDEQVRASLMPVEYVLVKGRVSLRDYARMIDLLANFNDMTRAITEVSSSDRLKGASGKDRAAIQQEIQVKFNSMKLDDKYVKNLLLIFRMFLGDRLALRVMPFPEAPDVRVVGPLRREFLRERLDDIRFKFGSSPEANWTVFGQIASVPQKSGSTLTPSLSFSQDFDKVFESVFQSLGELEDYFRVGYPEIAITPIAVYRD